ncbi:MAG TPA: hypothetical protein VMW81_10530 [Nitrospinota bacterium]|nr:hypothetical protein [Nitrospinota bacterium]
MNRKDFLLLLKEIHTPDYLKGKPFEQYSETIETFGRENFYPSDFSKAIKLMERFRISFSEEETSRFSKLTPQDIIRSNFLLKKIDPWVKNTQKKIFNSIKPPFNWNEAIEWIEKEAKKYIKNKDDMEINKVKELREELGKELAKEYKILSEKIYLLPYVKKDNEWVQKIHAIGLKLSTLECETRRMSKATGFNQASLVMFVLIGIKPLLPRYKISISIPVYIMPNKEQIISKEVEIVFRCRDLKFRELYEMYKKIRKQLNIEREIPLKGKSERVNELIEELGQPPLGTRGKRNQRYWEKAKDLWNNRNPDEQYSDWRGIAQQYDRITKFLERIERLNKPSF